MAIPNAIVGGVVLIKTRGKAILDYFDIRDSYYTHQQIELRDGLLFMRIKKRYLY